MRRRSATGSSATATAPTCCWTNNAILERQIGLPGGASVSLRAGGTQVWSLPNLHGDVVVVTDAAGTTQGVTSTYDPYGNPTLDQTPPDNSSGNFDYGWLGQHQRPLEHQPGLAPTIEMGARQYDPILGRFLELDPVEGGSCNDYDYTCNDLINGLDLDGRYTRGVLSVSFPRFVCTGNSLMVGPCLYVGTRRVAIGGWIKFSEKETITIDILIAAFGLSKTAAKKSMEQLVRLLQQLSLLKSVAALRDLDCLKVAWLGDSRVPNLNPGAFVGYLVRC